MDINKIKRSPSVPLPAKPVGGTAGGSAGGNFQGHLGSQLKEHFRQHVNELLDNLTSLSGTLLDTIDFVAFEKYRDMLRELLFGISRNAYLLYTERALDTAGRQRIFESVNIIDKKLDDLAKDVLNQNSDKLDYISRVDEIRGLILDLLF
jgi:uncharacterized protein YaaR (DUF327 family)